MSDDRNQILREGLSVGLIGATIIAAWFAIVDALSGNMFATPVMLGGALGTMLLQGALPSEAAAFLLYTVVHFAVFIMTGIFFAWAASSSERTPSAFIGFFGLFVVFEVWWVGWTTLLTEGFGQLMWYQVLVANLIAAGAMGYYMYRQHPELPRKVHRAITVSE